MAASSSSSSSYLQTGSRFDVLEFTISTDFFAHWFTCPSDFEACLDRLNNLFVTAEINITRDKTLRDSVIKLLTQRVLEIYPGWKVNIDYILEKFYRRERVNNGMQSLTLGLNSC